MFLTGGLQGFQGPDYFIGRFLYEDGTRQMLRSSVYSHNYAHDFYSRLD